MNFVVCDLLLCQLQCTDVIAMNILGVIILTLSWGYIRTQSLADKQRYSQLSGVPDRQKAYQQHLPSQESAALSEEQRIYLNWLENKRLPQIAQTAPIRQYENVNSLPLRPQLNEEPASLTNINEPYNLPQQNQIKLDLKKIQNTPVLQEPNRQNIQLRDILLPKVKYIQETPESINYPKRNQEVSNTPLRQNFDVQQIFSDPKIRKVLSTEEQTKRYMVLYPDGRVSHVDNVDLLLKSNPDHILINSKDLARSEIVPNFLRQTGNSKVSDPQNLIKKPIEANVVYNPINIILNETSSTSTSKPLNELKSNTVIVVQSLELQPNLTETVQKSTESNKIQRLQVSRVEGNQTNVTTKSTNVTVTSKNYNQTTESSIVPVNPIDKISPILNNIVHIGNNKTSNESNIISQKNQSLEVEFLENELNENKLNNASKVKSSNVTETHSVLATTANPEPPKPISEEKDSETLINNSDPSVPSSNSSQPSEDNDDSSSEKEDNESSSEQNKLEEETKINSSIGNADGEAKNKTQGDESLENNSSNCYNSDYSLEISEEQDTVSTGIERNSKISPKGKGKLTSQDGNAWRKVTVEKDDYDVVYSFDLPLQPVSIVDSDGESHPCFRLLDPFSLLTLIICQ